ncbi:hypothetical protein BH10CHL1_BH10CHL1_34940 [soil metagenome]
MKKLTQAAFQQAQALIASQARVLDQQRFLSILQLAPQQPFWQH